MNDTGRYFDVGHAWEHLEHLLPRQPHQEPRVIVIIAQILPLLACAATFSLEPRQLSLMVDYLIGQQNREAGKEARIVNLGRLVKGVRTLIGAHSRRIFAFLTESLNEPNL